MRHRVAAACARTSSAHLCECAIALQQHAYGPTPRTHANAPSYRVAADCVRANSACSCECAILSRCSGLCSDQLRALTRLRHLIAFRRLACRPVPRTHTNAPSRCSGMRAHQLRVLTRMRHLTRFGGWRVGQLRALTRMRHRVAAACARTNSAHLCECAIALQRHAYGPTPRTYANAPSYRVAAACVRANSAHSRECAIAFQRHARTNRICPRLGAAACAQSVLRMGFSRRRCPRVYAPCVSPCRVFARSAVSALCRPCAVRQTPLSRAATDAPCSGCACQSSTGHTFRIPP